ncbi:MAG: ROK family protein, partial [Candidatus Sericytochromatia bacterium]
VGTGIGAGLILNGRIYLGAGGFAGELGHTLIEWRGEAGTLEQLASGTALSRRAAAALAAGRESRLRAMTPPGQPVALETIQAAYEEGDALAVELVSELAEMLGAGVTNVINLLNPEMVVLGGGGFRSLPVLVERVAAVVERRGLPGAVAGCTIVPGHFGREAGVIGATVFAKLAGSLEASGPGRAPDDAVSIRPRVP